MSLVSYPPLGSSYKDVQNFLVGHNLVRKSTQLTNDLALIRQREANPEYFVAKAKQSTTLSKFNQRIQQSIDDIIDIRKKLGIKEPQGHVNRSLDALLKPQKGSTFNSLI